MTLAELVITLMLMFIVIWVSILYDLNKKQIDKAVGTMWSTFDQWIWQMSKKYF